MSTLVSAESHLPDVTNRLGAAPETTHGHSAALGWSALVGLWLLQLPLLLAMPLTNDAAVYDIQARNVLAGGVLYRDLFEPNLPGVVWLHMAVRSTLGWSSTALRAFDLTVWLGIIVLAAGHLRRLGGSVRLAVWAMFALSAFYFASSEWIHCQRDTWLLLPTLAALELRARQAERLGTRYPPRSLILWAVVEGAVWGLAVWIKPHILLPAAAAWCAVAWTQRRPRHLAFDALGLVAGGLAVGALGIVWLVATDAWPAFVETARTWTPRYVAAGKEHWTFPRLVGMSVRMFPWLFVHLAAMAAAAAIAVKVLRRQPSSTATTNRLAIVAAGYALWTFQAFVLQHLFDYVHAPPIILGILLVAAWLAQRPQSKWNWAAAAALGLTILVSPLAKPDRWSAWLACVEEGSTPELRDRLRRLATPEWQYQEQVAQWLEGQGVEPGAVLAVNDSLVHLYARLATRPPTRFIYLEQTYFLFPEYRDQLRELVQAAPHRYAVVNLVECGLSYQAAHAVADGNPLALPPAVRRNLRGAYPWSHPIVYRAGPYLVFAIERPVGKLLLPAPRQTTQTPPAQQHQADQRPQTTDA